jgi:hypothetical protein
MPLLILVDPGHDTSISTPGRTVLFLTSDLPISLDFSFYLALAFTNSYDTRLAFLTIQ